MSVGAECPGGYTGDHFIGCAMGLCPACNEFVALLANGHTVRHRAEPLGASS